MRRLKNWFIGERQKLSGYSVMDKLDYIWGYYRLWVVGILGAVLLLGFVVFRLVTVPSENYLYAVFANTYAELGEGSAFQKDFARYAGVDLKKKNVVFNTNIYCKPSVTTFGNQYYEALVSLLDSGALDALIMEREDIEFLGAYGRLLDLEDERVSAILNRWADRMIYVAPDEESGYAKNSVPVGIDLSDTALVGEFAPYSTSAVLGIGANAVHFEQVAVLLEYLTGEVTL